MRRFLLPIFLLVGGASPAAARTWEGIRFQGDRFTVACRDSSLALEFAGTRELLVRGDSCGIRTAGGVELGARAEPASWYSLREGTDSTLRICQKYGMCLEVAAREVLEVCRDSAGPALPVRVRSCDATSREWRTRSLRKYVVLGVSGALVVGELVYLIHEMASGLGSSGFRMPDP